MNDEHPWKLAARVGCVVAGCGVGVVVSAVVVLGAAYLQMLIQTQNEQSHRSELGENVRAIKTAQLAYDAVYDEFVEVPRPVPRSVDQLGSDAVYWPPDTAFDTLGWAPDEMVRGTYWVELKDGGDDFVVHGMADMDDDGEAAHFTATKATNLRMLTEHDVY